MLPKTDNPRETRDAWLGGALMLWQPATGYRAGVDPVLLAAACPARPGDTVLELGCGVGTASFCLAHRVPRLTVTAVERQPGIAALARRNAAATNLSVEVVTADLAHLPESVRQRSFHHVIVNPPYFDRARSVASTDAPREAAMGEDTPLWTWLDTAARRLRPRGWLTLIHRSERLPDILAGLDGRLGSISVLPLIPRSGRDASLLLIRARKDGRAPFRLCAPCILHEGDRHVTDAEDYTPDIAAVLREGRALPGFGD